MNNIFLNTLYTQTYEKHGKVLLNALSKIRILFQKYSSSQLNDNKRQVRRDENV